MIAEDQVRLLTVQQVADRLAISEREVYRMISTGELASFKLGRKRRVELAELARFIAEQRGAGAS